MSSLFLTNSYAKTICSPDDRVTLKESGFPNTQDADKYLYDPTLPTPNK